MRGYYQNQTPKGIKICHADHGLTEEHIAFLDEVLVANRNGGKFFQVVVKLPDHLPDLPAALYGPSVGDAPITECMVRYTRRPNRSTLTRFVDLPERRTRYMVVIGRLKKGKSKVATAYGASFIAPRSPGSPQLTEDERLESERFWSEHALSYDSVIDAMLESSSYLRQYYSKIPFEDLGRSGISSTAA